MPHVYVIISRLSGRLFLYLMNSKLITRQLHKALPLDVETMSHLHVIVSRI